MTFFNQTIYYNSCVVKYVYLKSNYTTLTKLFWLSSFIIEKTRFSNISPCFHCQKIIYKVFYCILFCFLLLRLRLCTCFFFDIYCFFTYQYIKTEEKANPSHQMAVSFNNNAQRQATQSRPDELQHSLHNMQVSNHHYYHSLQPSYAHQNSTYYHRLQHSERLASDEFGLFYHSSHKLMSFMSLLCWACDYKKWWFYFWFFTESSLFCFLLYI